MPMNATQKFALEALERQRRFGTNLTQAQKRAIVLSATKYGNADIAQKAVQQNPGFDWSRVRFSPVNQIGVSSQTEALALSSTLGARIVENMSYSEMREYERTGKLNKRVESIKENAANMEEVARRQTMEAQTAAERRQQIIARAQGPTREAAGQLSTTTGQATGPVSYVNQPPKPSDQQIQQTAQTIAGLKQRAELGQFKERLQVTRLVTQEGAARSAEIIQGAKILGGTAYLGVTAPAGVLASGAGVVASGAKAAYSAFLAHPLLIGVPSTYIVSTNVAKGVKGVSSYFSGEETVSKALGLEQKGDYSQYVRSVESAPKGLGRSIAYEVSPLFASERMVEAGYSEAERIAKARGLSDVETFYFIRGLESQRRSAAFGELAGAVAANVGSEIVGEAAVGKAFQKIGSIPASQLQSRLFGLSAWRIGVAGFGEGAAIVRTQQVMRGYTEPILPYKENVAKGTYGPLDARSYTNWRLGQAGQVVGGGLFGFATASLIGGYIVSRSVTKPTSSKVAMAAVYLTDPYEYVGDVLAEQGIKRAAGFPRPIVTFTGNVPTYVLSSTPVTTQTQTMASKASRGPTFVNTLTNVLVPNPVDVPKTNKGPSVPDYTYIELFTPEPISTQTLTPVNTNTETNYYTSTNTNINTMVGTPTSVNTMVNIPIPVTVPRPAIPLGVPPSFPAGGGGGFGSRVGKRVIYANELALMNNLLFGSGIPKKPQVIKERPTKRRKSHKEKFGIPKVRL